VPSAALPLLNFVLDLNKSHAGIEAALAIVLITGTFDIVKLSNVSPQTGDEAGIDWRC
jgi:hypothetical protein